jgi:type III secretion protein U
MAEKSEKATPKKLRDARKKGQVAKSQDFPSSFTFAASLLLILAWSGFLWDKLTEFMSGMFRASTIVDIKGAAGEILNNLLFLILQVTLPIAGLVALIGVVVNFLIIGPMWGTEGLKPDLKRLNPVTGLKNKFKMKTVVELIKSMLKIGIAAYIIYRVIWADVDSIVHTAALTPLGSAYVVAGFLRKVAIRVGVFFLAVGIFDLFYQKRVFAKEMKMEKFQVKQEHKDLEGDPQIKGRRRQIAQEVAYDEGPRAARRARAVITNPEHIAIAIGYEPEKYGAPYILTLGAGSRADAILKVAETSNVPIMRNVPLAWQLFQGGAPNRFIPEETYEAVAEVLRWIISLEEGGGEIAPPFLE